ncbi:GNAT family N-acetyltransferase [Paenibacillus sp. R14(2021)]|uniref:GNAT family N-acetyltransferase n=1 Tax=Paenibacillus sp. R14(2021) TaxID=2859228 RepID=UPI001C614A27|nr:GNAT family N-acetyltransferase [Paenibacillus sp. R14(2021)]
MSRAGVNAGIVLRLMQEEELQAAHELELSCYSELAAASREAFSFRQKHFPAYFWSAWEGGRLIGLACGVRTEESSCEGDAVKSTHDADLGGRHLCVLSVAVAENSRQKGIGSMLMEALIRQAAEDKLASVVLMCERHLIRFYEALGFRYAGLSSSTHGGIEWHEMNLQLA